MARVGRLVNETMVEELSTQLAERKNFFVTSVTRLPAPETDVLRQKLHHAQASLRVIKRRLGLRAIDALKIDGLEQLFEGPIGLVLTGDDVLLTAKTIEEFRKTHEGQVAVKGGVVDGQLLDARRVGELAGLPPKPVLLAHVVFTLELPLADLIWTIEQLIGDIAWIAEQAAEKKSATPETTEPTKEGT